MYKLFRSCWFAPAAFLLDRLTKLWAQAALRGQEVLDIWPGVLRFVYVENTGAAFGMLTGKQGFLLVVSGIALAGLFGWLLLRGQTIETLPRVSLWLLLGGALGNFFDRLVYGYVIDFIEIRLFTFPVFNIADACVCVVFAVLAVYILLHKDIEEAKPDVG